MYLDLNLIGCTVQYLNEPTSEPIGFSVVRYEWSMFVLHGAFTVNGGHYELVLCKNCFSVSLCCQIGL